MRSKATRYALGSSKLVLRVDELVTTRTAEHAHDGDGAGQALVIPFGRLLCHGVALMRGRGNAAAEWCTIGEGNDGSLHAIGLPTAQPNARDVGIRIPGT